jgi:hypothetical protein
MALATLKTSRAPSPELTAVLKALRSKNGATRARLQEIAGRASAPDAWHLSRMAKRYGFKLTTAENKDGLTLYRFV